MMRNANVHEAQQGAGKQARAVALRQAAGTASTFSLPGEPLSQQAIGDVPLFGLTRVECRRRAASRIPWPRDAKQATREMSKV